MVGSSGRCLYCDFVPHNCSWFQWTHFIVTLFPTTVLGLVDTVFVTLFPTTVLGSSGHSLLWLCFPQQFLILVDTVFVTLFPTTVLGSSGHCLYCGFIPHVPHNCSNEQVAKNTRCFAMATSPPPYHLNITTHNYCSGGGSRSFLFLRVGVLERYICTRHTSAVSTQLRWIFKKRAIKS